MPIELFQRSVAPAHLAAKLSNDLEAMRQDATDRDVSTFEKVPNLPPATAAVSSPAGHPGNVLSAAQQTAIALLIAGRSPGAVAGALKLHRSTISRWRHQHPLFAAELARRQREVYDTATRRLQLLMVKAIGVVDGMLRTPRVQEDAAWKVLRGLSAATWTKPQPVAEAESQEWPDDLATPTSTRAADQSAIADVIRPGRTAV